MNVSIIILAIEKNCVVYQLNVVETASVLRDEISMIFNFGCSLV